jgi:cellulose synthase operon protein C
VSAFARLRCAWALLAFASVAATSAQAQPALLSLYQRGEYDGIIAQQQRATTALDKSIVTRALTDVGRATDALAYSSARRTDPDVAAARARACEALGRLADADSAWLVAERGGDSLFVVAARARLRVARGDRGGAQAIARALFDLVEARGGPRSPSEAHALAIAARMLAPNDPQQVREALRWYDRAIAADSLRLDARAELGALFLEKFNFTDARQTLERLLTINPKHPQALLSLARLYALDGRNEGRDPLAILLAVNARHSDGHALAARRLIDAEQYADAITEARRGLVDDSTAPAPWIAIAAARWLSRDTSGHRAALATAHTRLPGSALAETEMAELVARNRLYRDAVSFARAGVARDSNDAHALATLGINLLRVGGTIDARATLQRSFALDPFNVWVKNTLDLLDSYATARTITTPHFDFVVESRDAELMGLYAAPLAEEAWTALTTRYGYQPSERVRVEFFRSHDDFSVRAVGLGGLGALGVAFGNVLAIDAPPARTRGEFNWASVLWHEFAHTITLGMTDNRVPRWVSEGLSVYEERRARPEWGGGATPTLIAAYGAGMLHPVSRLNDGFVRPRYAAEVTLSYALSAYVFEMLEERKGIDGIRALLRGYRDGADTPALVRRIYALEPAALDSVFDHWFRARFTKEFTAVRGERNSTEGTPSFTLAGALPDALRDAERAAARKRSSAWRVGRWSSSQPTRSREVATICLRLRISPAAIPPQRARRSWPSLRATAKPSTRTSPSLDCWRPPRAGRARSRRCAGRR